MSNEQIIKCTFCQGTGDNPHFKGICPVCKGKGKNNVIGKCMTCSSCRGSGQKGGTTLTCYDCGGLGVIPDTREIFIRAREEIKEAREEMAKERPARHSFSEGREELTDSKTHFCQCCGDKVNESMAIKICLNCFGKVKELKAYTYK